MNCVACGSATVTERPERTAQGYRRFRRRNYGKHIDPALIILVAQRSGTAGAGRRRGSAAAAWTGYAYAVITHVPRAGPACPGGGCARSHGSIPIALGSGM